MATIRPECPGDAAAIHAIHAASFPTTDEARLVDALRAAGRLCVSLVAVERAQIVGHVAFSPVSVPGTTDGVGLAPVAVLPGYRRRGVAAQLVREGLAACQRAGYGFVVVLGEPGYYRRFGFAPATRWGLHDEYGGGDAFQALELRPGAVPPCGGLARYAEEFARIDSAPRVPCRANVAAEAALPAVRMNDYTSIAELYDSYVADTRDHAFWSRQAAQATGPILELTAGTGRATVALLRASSQPLVALDLAPAMLRRLVARVRHASRPAWAVAGDVTRLPFSSGQFGLVVIPFNSFGELIETPERAVALRELRRVLAPAGRAVVTLHDPARRRQTLDGEVRQLGPFPAGDRRLEVLVRGRLITSELAESEQTYRVLGAGDRVLEERRLTLRFVLPDAASLVGMAVEAGLEVQALFGDYDESPYVPGNSPFVLAVLRRA